jgi:S-adenosylmethionine:tRNA ribosyltransferase-isomerase
MKVVLPDVEQTAPARASVFDFTLPPELEADAPAEERGLTRDGVRLLISYRSSDTLLHTSFRALDTILREGDALVINTSGTLKAALPATRPNGLALEAHLSTQLPGGFWTVELREPGGIGSRPFRGAVAGEALALPAGGTLALLAPYPATPAAAGAPPRLWLATLRLPLPLLEYLDAHGEPIRYNYARERWPISAYQTVYADTPGSAEMPSAGRAFTQEIMARLVARGVQIVPLLLHCGVASLEEHEPPFEEWYRVAGATADAINAARARGGRDRSARAGDGDGPARHRPPRRGLDEPGALARAAAARSGCAADRLARAARLAPGAAGRARIAGAPQAGVRRGAVPRLPLA